MLHIKISTYANGKKKISILGFKNCPEGYCITEEEGDFYNVVGDDRVPDGETIIDPCADCAYGSACIVDPDTHKTYYLEGSVFALSGASVFLKSVDGGKNVGQTARVLLDDGEYYLTEDGVVGRVARCEEP